MTIHIFGIRHHGPGSARSLLSALEALQPDCILVEGPPDADNLLPLMMQDSMQPPVALLIYDPANTRRAAYYPFAEFSPEWQALRYGLAYAIPTRFMDLPQSNAFALQPDPKTLADLLPVEETVPLSKTSPEGDSGVSSDDDPVAETSSEDFTSEIDPVRLDPLRALAEAAGYNDSERWWEHLVEQRLDSSDLFAAILEAMTALREQTSPLDPFHEHNEMLREAHMRKTIREAEKASYQRIAVVCGAWHTPALVNMPPAKADNTLLKGLAKVKTKATWVPWTHGRLARVSGYGAGIESPGWYAHLWRTPTHEIAIRWMAHVARLLRDERLDASTAQVIDAVRLSETLAALRARPVPGLTEMNEAAQAVICFGQPEPMRIIERKLIVGETMGTVPDETPTVPLQQDLQALQKRLRLKVEPVERVVELDLRKSNDLERSHLLHRLLLLQIPWGRADYNVNKTGTFRENWVLVWRPELAINVIEASIWGNTVRDGAAAFAQDRADQAEDLRALSELLTFVILCDLPDATAHLMKRLETQATLTSDVTLLMAALPALAQTARYTNVRALDRNLVAQVIDGMVVRLCIGLAGAVASLDDAAATQMFTLILGVQSALRLLQNEEQITLWFDTLQLALDRDSLHGLLAGRFARILLDARRLDAAEGTRRMKLALARAADPVQAAAWVEGFLRESGSILIYDDQLWGVIDEWVTSLPGELFPNLLPLLRRTFATFSSYERQQIGERARQGQVRAADGSDTIDHFDAERAASVLPLIKQLLGLPAST
ncbi:MAG: hypothetical protein GC204_12065 [Chloroflexi bacterium]|nr:hypothetical protein [Chloroflexota bacterium]